MTHDKRIDRHFIHPQDPSYWKARRIAFGDIRELKRLIGEREAARKRLKELSAAVEDCAVEIAWNPNVVSILRSTNRLSLLTQHSVELGVMEKAHKAIADEYETEKDAWAEYEQSKAEYDKAKKSGTVDEIQTAAEDLFYAEGYYHSVSSGDLGLPIEVQEAELAHMSDDEHDDLWHEFQQMNLKGTAEYHRYYNVFMRLSMKGYVGH